LILLQHYRLLNCLQGEKGNKDPVKRRKEVKINEDVFSNDPCSSDDPEHERIRKE